MPPENEKNRRAQGTELPMIVVWLVLAIIGLVIVIMVATKGKEIFTLGLG